MLSALVAALTVFAIFFLTCSRFSMYSMLVLINKNTRKEGSKVCQHCRPRASKALPFLIRKHVQCSCERWNLRDRWARL